MKVLDILNFLDRKFPLDTACDFDNVGLLIGDGEQKVTKAVVALDCTLSAIETAKANGCELIITHHPIIFNPLKNVLKGSIVYSVIENGLSVVNGSVLLEIVKSSGCISDCNL